MNWNNMKGFLLPYVFVLYKYSRAKSMCNMLNTSKPGDKISHTGTGDLNISLSWGYVSRDIISPESQLIAKLPKRKVILCLVYLDILMAASLGQNVPAHSWIYLKKIACGGTLWIKAVKCREKKLWIEKLFKEVIGVHPGVPTYIQN